MHRISYVMLLRVSGGLSLSLSVLIMKGLGHLTAAGAGIFHQPRSSKPGLEIHVYVHLLQTEPRQLHRPSIMFFHLKNIL
jgi:hypothetical protein